VEAIRVGVGKRFDATFNPERDMKKRIEKERNDWLGASTKQKKRHRFSAESA
jgi:hypothetical protein